MKQVALNITFAGNIIDSENNPINDDSVKYQAYFKKTNAGSSNNKWNNPRISEYGQYSLNLGDGDLLTQDGKVSNNDKLIILFWREKKEVKESVSLSEWCFVETTLNGSEVYLANIKLSKSIKPNNLFIQSGINKVNKQIIISDNGTNDNHEYIFEGKTLKQTSEFFTGMNTLPNNCVTIDWGDNTLKQTFNAGFSANHAYSLPGDYVLSITVTNSCGLQTMSTFTIRVFWNEPIVDFELNQTSFLPQGENGLGKPIICTNKTSDPDNRDTIDNWYYIYELDGEDYTEITKDISQIFCATSHGLHEIKLNCYWYNGFEYKVLSKSKTITQDKWSLEQSLLYDEPVFLNTPNNYKIELFGDSSHFKSNKIIIDDTLKYTPNKEEIFSHTFSIPKQQVIKSIISFYNGFEIEEIEKEYIISLSTKPSFSNEEMVEGILFKNTSILGAPPLSNIEWKVTNIDNDNIMAILTNDENFIYTLFQEGKYKITLTITDSNNKSFSISEIFEQKFSSYGKQTIFIADVMELEISDQNYELEISEEIITLEIEE